ncbi:rhoptry neck protein 4 [Plasmodium sp. gorilla clade G2]|uniref:rhoptry neck protein 4 n=1 Tax=Plasmodium sp. gorilla clade G2 TaxID=880535 RepID=UPI000D22B1C1|nr:rhoptry neck protein 4 [Plasmodium sp. gorilla clade G2]SOV15533.1 rhoptry neck protein 4 [Plasmodium sp. gorilla clade G2]
MSSVRFFLCIFLVLFTFIDIVKPFKGNYGDANYSFFQATPVNNTEETQKNEPTDVQSNITQNEEINNTKPLQENITTNQQNNNEQQNNNIAQNISEQQNNNDTTVSHTPNDTSSNTIDNSNINKLDKSNDTNNIIKHEENNQTKGNNPETIQHTEPLTNQNTNEVKINDHNEHEKNTAENKIEGQHNNINHHSYDINKNQNINNNIINENADKNVPQLEQTANSNEQHINEHTTNHPIESHMGEHNHEQINEPTHSENATTPTNEPTHSENATTTKNEPTHSENATTSTNETTHNEHATTTKNEAIHSENATNLTNESTHSEHATTLTNEATHNEHVTTPTHEATHNEHVSNPTNVPTHNKHATTPTHEATHNEHVTNPTNEATHSENATTSTNEQHAHDQNTEVHPNDKLAVVPFQGIKNNIPSNESQPIVSFPNEDDNHAHNEGSINTSVEGEHNNTENKEGPIITPLEGEKEGTANKEDVTPTHIVGEHVPPQTHQGHIITPVGGQHVPTQTHHEHMTTPVGGQYTHGQENNDATYMTMNTDESSNSDTKGEHSNLRAYNKNMNNNKVQNDKYDSDTLSSDGLDDTYSSMQQNFDKNGIDSFKGKGLHVSLRERIIMEIMESAKNGIDGLLKLKDSKDSGNLFMEALEKLNINIKELNKNKNLISLEVYDKILSTMFKILTEMSFYEDSKFYETLGIKKDILNQSLKDIKIKILRKIGVSYSRLPPIIKHTEGKCALKDLIISISSKELAQRMAIMFIKWLSPDEYGSVVDYKTNVELNVLCSGAPILIQQWKYYQNMLGFEEDKDHAYLGLIDELLVMNKRYSENKDYVKTLENIKKSKVFKHCTKIMRIGGKVSSVPFNYENVKKPSSSIIGSLGNLIKANISTYYKATAQRINSYFHYTEKKSKKSSPLKIISVCTLLHITDMLYKCSDENSNGVMDLYNLQFNTLNMKGKMVLQYLVHLKFLTEEKKSHLKEICEPQNGLIDETLTKMLALLSTDSHELLSHELENKGFDEDYIQDEIKNINESDNNIRDKEEDDAENMIFDDL